MVQFSPWQPCTVNWKGVSAQRHGMSVGEHSEVPMLAVKHSAWFPVSLCPSRLQSLGVVD